MSSGKQIFQLCLGPLVCLFLISVVIRLSFEKLDGHIVFASTIVAVFLALALFASLKNVVFNFRRKSALTTQPVEARVEVVQSGASRRGVPSLVAEIYIGDTHWRAILTAYRHDRSMIGKSGPGKAWLFAQTGAPLAVEFGGEHLSLVPAVMRVKSDSLMEKVIQFGRRF